MAPLKQHHFVFVHGACHGAWCWARIVPLLEKAGNRVTTVDLVGAGDNPQSADDVTSLQEYNQPLEDLFASFPGDEKVILVGHSLGGMSLTYMSELCPKMISVAVYLSAFMPGPGVNLFEMARADPNFSPTLEWGFSYKVEGGPPTAQIFTPADVKEYLYNKCSPEDCTIAQANLRMTPLFSTTLASVQGTKENYGSVPKVYVLPLSDKAMTPYAARKLIALNPPNEVIEIDADHSMFFSAVDIVVKIPLDAAAKYDS